MKMFIVASVSTLALCASCKQREFNDAEENSLRSKDSDKRVAVDVKIKPGQTDSSVVVGCAWQYHEKSTNLSEKIDPLSKFPFDATAEGLKVGGSAAIGATLVAVGEKLGPVSNKVAKYNGYFVMKLAGVVFLFSTIPQAISAYNKSQTLKNAFSNATVSETEFLAAVDLLKKSGNRIYGQVCDSKTLSELKALDKK